MKPDWFEEIKLFSIRNPNISLNISLSSTFPEIEAMGLVGNFQALFIMSLINWDYLRFFPFQWKRTSVDALNKMNCKC